MMQPVPLRASTTRTSHRLSRIEACLGLLIVLLFAALTPGYCDIPRCNSNSYSTSCNTTLTVAAPGLLANDHDSFFSPLTASLVAGPSHGVLTFNADGSFTYAPAYGFRGIDKFSYTCSNGVDPVSNVAYVWITVMNRVPVANSNSYTTDENIPLQVDAPGVLANDYDSDHDALSVILVDQPRFGTVTLAIDGSFVYTPKQKYVGPDRFSYRVSDGRATSNLAYVWVTTAARNRAPIAYSESYTAQENLTLTVAAPGVLANDIDADHNALTVSLTEQPRYGGSVTLQADGSFVYTPPRQYVGFDRFAYVVSDGKATSNTAYVWITMTPSNRTPTAYSDSYTTPENAALTVTAPGLLGNDEDPDGDPLTVSLVDGPSHGTLTPHADGSYTYLPEWQFVGVDSFTYRVSDGKANSNTASVWITVTDANRAPTAYSDSYTVTANALLSIRAAQGVLFNDADPDGDFMSASIVSSPAHATVTLRIDGSLVIMPEADYVGLDTFTYKVNDGKLDSNVATVWLTIVPADNTPLALNDSYATPVNTPLVVNAPGVLVNDRDKNGDALTAAVVATTAHGALVLASDGSFVYTPDSGFTGTDAFTYEASNGLQTSAPATVVITVN